MANTDIANQKTELSYDWSKITELFFDFAKDQPLVAFGMLATVCGTVVLYGYFTSK